ncbi:MAG TPA: molybdate ABC transporter substrate-binding protein [Woeseiaceae bacterium]|nr:molybdate ABC transporter substrate-binding protein [Woeseiaceae bacterium]
MVARTAGSYTTAGTRYDLARMAAHRLLTLLVLLTTATGAAAGTVRSAVAANFVPALQALKPDFERQSGHKLRISSASTGTLYAQILNAAPFDVFLAADTKRPRRLIDAGLADPSSAFVYARGRLVLWSADPDLIDGTDEVLRSERFERLALANPRTAPYGAAARQVLRNLGLEQALAGRLVQGKNVAQAWQFVATENAELGFVALSQPIAAGVLEDGSRWLVPPELYDPIAQMAVVLRSADDREAADALMLFLRSGPAVDKIERLGYDAAGQVPAGDATADPAQ